MLAAKFVIALFLGALAVQAKPQVKDDSQLKAPIDDVVQILADLDRVATNAQQRAIDRFGDEIRSFEKTSEGILQGLEDDLEHSDVIYEVQISQLEEKAYEFGVDIRSCVANSLDEIADIPPRLLRESQQCITVRHARADDAIDEGIQEITKSYDKIDKHWKQVDVCRKASIAEREICVARLDTEVRNDQVLIPVKINLTVQEVTGELDSEKVEIRICVLGKLDKLDEEAGRIVRRVTECAENRFPPEPTPFK